MNMDNIKAKVSAALIALGVFLRGIGYVTQAEYVEQAVPLLVQLSDVIIGLGAAFGVWGVGEELVETKKEAVRSRQMMMRSMGMKPLEGDEK